VRIERLFMKEDFFDNLTKEVLEIKDRNPQLSDDNAFVAWFLRAFIAEDEKQAIEALTGKAGDKSSDAIYIDHDNRLVFIVQGKYHSHNHAVEPRSHVIALADLGRSILCDRSEAFKAILNKANPTVQKKLEEARNYIYKRDYQLVLRYVTTGKISDTHIEEGESRIEEFDNGRFETYSYNDLMKLMQDYIEGAAPPIPTLPLPVKGIEVFSRTDASTGITSWIFTMGGPEVGNLFNTIGVRLFARNIRGYLGKTEINRVMNKTIEKEPDYFWYYNNGITIVCDEAKQIKKGSSNIIKATNAQIINGQQTTRTLAIAGKNKAEVLVKLVEIPRENDTNKNQYRHLVSEIVSATNWQNEISQSDLKSNDIEQVRIEKEFKKLNYFYIRKRMSKSEAVKYGANKFSYRINKDELARAVAACTVDPYEVRLGKDRLFEDDIYNDIFNGRKASDYITIYWLYRYVSYWSKGDDRKVYAKWHVLNLLWKLLEHPLRKNLYRDVFRKMAERENRYYNELKPLDKLIKELFLCALHFYWRYKKIDGKVQEARDLFKHVDLDRKFYSYFNRSGHQKRKIKSQIKAFLYNMDNLNE
jgi:AIPR protein